MPSLILDKIEVYQDNSIYLYSGKVLMIFKDIESLERFSLRPVPNMKAKDDLWIKAAISLIAAPINSWQALLPLEIV